MATNETKREPAISTEVRNGVLHIMFPRIERRLVVEPGTLDGSIIAQAVIHGLKQKLIDAAAISRNPDTGKPATDADKYLAVLEVYNRITGDNPSWNAVREGSGAASYLLQALCRLQPTKTREELKTWLETKTAEQRRALETNPKVAAIIGEIKAERANALGIDSDELLGEIA